MSASAADIAEGRLVALQTIAEHGAGVGWAAVPAKVRLLVRIARCDLDRPADAERRHWLIGWGLGVLKVADRLVDHPTDSPADFDALADFVRAAVLDTELAAMQP